MARTPKTAPQAPSTMKELKDTLWKAADKLRGSMDASQYKDVILGLVFLKYVSDAFDERRGQIRAELAADDYDDEQIAELIDDTDALGHFVRSEVAPAELTDRRCVKDRALFHDHNGGNFFSARRMRQPDNGGALYIWMHEQHLLHLGGADVEAARNDELFNPINDGDKAVF